MLGTNALDVYGFDQSLMESVSERVGPELSAVTGIAEQNGAA
jgi:hypothetical protein